MCQRERNGMQPQRLRSKFARIAKQNPPTEEKFPANQIKERGPWQANCIGLVIVMHGDISSPQIINNRSHEQYTNRCNDETSFPIAERETKFPGVFTKEKDNDDQRDDEIKNDPIQIFCWSELMIV